jgi:hypothetical protein
MPTPEQWQQYAQSRNQYRHGTPEPQPPKTPIGRQVFGAIAQHYGRPDSGGQNLYPANYGFGATAPQSSALPDPGISDSAVGAGMDAGSAQSYNNSQFESQRIARVGAQQPQTLTPYVDMPIPPQSSRQSLTSLGNGYGVTGSNASGRAGYAKKTYYDLSGNAVASGLSSATGRGGFGGADTDAQAATALQDRAAQNQAAQFNIDSMNRAADSMREARASRLGVGRGTLDRMEGRMDTEAAAADSAAQGAIPDRWFNPFSMPGDSFQDTRGRQAEYNRAIEQAMTGNRRQQQGAQVALQGLGGMADMNQKDRAGLAQVDANRYAADASRYNAEQKAMADQYATQQSSALEASKQRYERGRNREQDYWNIADKKSQIETRGLPKPPNLQETQANIVSSYQKAMEQLGLAKQSGDPKKIDEAEKAAAFYLKMYNDLGFNRQTQEDGLTVPARS